MPPIKVNVLSEGSPSHQVRVSDVDGVLQVVCDCAAPSENQCVHKVAVILGDRAAVLPSEVNTLIQANLLIAKSPDYPTLLAACLGDGHQDVQ